MRLLLPFPTKKEASISVHKNRSCVGKNDVVLDVMIISVGYDYY